MLLNIINYSFRAVVIAIGILLICGVFTPHHSDGTMFVVTGIVVCLFGVYRIVTYWSKNRIMQREMEDEDEE